VALTPNRPPSRSEQKTERQSPGDNALLREVDEAVFHDQMLFAAKRFGIPLLGTVLAGLLAFGGYLWWQENRETMLENKSEELIRAIDNVSAGHFDTASKALAPVAEDSVPGVEAAAKLLRAGIALHEDRKDDAIKLYAEVAQDKSVPAPYRDIASIRGVAANFDTMKPEDVVAKLKPLAVPGNPWFGSAGELVGAAYLKQGKTELAGPLFAAIAKDEDVPDSLRSRARQLAGMLGFDAITDAETFVKAAEAGPPATSAQ